LSHDRLGYNYRLSDINCAIGVVQMRRLEEIVDARQRVAHSYINHLLDESHVILPTIDEQTVMSWFVFIVRLTNDLNRDDRDGILSYLRNHHIGCSNYFPPIHLQPFYAREYGYKRGDFPVTEYVSDRTIALPFHGRISEEEIETVVHHLKQAIGHRLKGKE
jgi:perosamine synthetase